MAESFLEEQLKRMKEMSEQMSRVSSKAAELPNEMAREREMQPQDALHEVRDLRTCISPRPEPRDRSDDHAPTSRRKTRQPPRRRR
jgi:hypothetical protein